MTQSVTTLALRAIKPPKGRWIVGGDLYQRHAPFRLAARKPEPPKKPSGHIPNWSFSAYLAQRKAHFQELVSRALGREKRELHRSRNLVWKEHGSGIHHGIEGLRALSGVR
jgi:hypothetical protein